jgi:hypothetical protein
MGRRRPAATATLAASLFPKTFPRTPLSLPVLAVPRTEAGIAKARVLRRSAAALHRVRAPAAARTSRKSSAVRCVVDVQD